MADNKNKNAAPGGAPPIDPAKKQELAQKAAKDRKKLIIIIACIAVVSLALLIIIIGVLGGKSGADGETVPQPSYFESTAPAASPTLPADDSTTLLPTETQSLTTEQSEESAAPTEAPTTAQPAATTPAASSEEAQAAAGQQETEPFTIEELEPFTKTGDNILSDSKNNEFIKIVSEKYGVEPERLVAIYAVPDKGNNFVLEFSGETDSEGNIIKSPDTLYRIHLVDLKRDVKTATGKITGNKGVSFAEGILTMQMIKDIVMPQHADYFTGVEQPD